MYELLDWTTEGCFSLDSKSRIRYLNAAMEQWSGKPRGEAIGKPYWEVWPELKGTRLQKLLGAAMKSCSITEFEYHHEPAGRWFAVRVGPDRSGRLWVFFQDITARQEAEDEKRTAHQRAVEVLEAMSDGFFALDEQSRFSYVNARAEEAWRKSRQELLGKVIWEEFPDAVGSDIYLLLRRVTAGQRRVRFVSNSPLGRSAEMDVHACPGGVCVYFRPVAVAEARGPVPPPFAEQIVAAQEEERQRIARELHDNTGQLLAALAFGLRALGDTRTLSQAKTQAGKLRRITSRMFNDLGQLTRALHTTTLRERGLPEALRQLCIDFSQTYRLRIRLSARQLSGLKLPMAVQLAAYRIVQEAVSNAGRHAHARHVRVTCRVLQHHLQVEIQDDGRGFEPQRVRSSGDVHLGLYTMRERAEMLGGYLAIHSTTGQGTLVRAAIPIDGVSTKSAA